MEVLPIRTPVQSNTAWLARFCEDFYFCSNHKRRIKAHTKLANDVGNRVTRFTTGFQLLNKCLRKQEFNIYHFKKSPKDYLRAWSSDGAQVIDGLFPIHADTRILPREEIVNKRWAGEINILLTWIVIVFISLSV